MNTLEEAIAALRQRAYAEEGDTSPHDEPEDAQTYRRDARRRARTVIVADGPSAAIEAFRVLGDIDWDVPYLVGKHTPLIHPDSLREALGIPGEVDPEKEEMDISSFIFLLVPGVGQDIESELLGRNARVFRADPGFGIRDAGDPDDWGEFVHIE